MNKTFTMIVASMAVVSLAVASIETAPAGYLEKSGDDTLVCNPFVSFGGGAGTLADVEGTADSALRIVHNDGTVTDYQWDSGKKYWVEKGESADAGATELPRGAGFQLDGSETVIFAGILTNRNETVDISVGNNLWGNASLSGRNLSNLTVEGFDINRDYVRVGTTKYVFSNNKWYVKSDYEAGLRNAVNPAIGSGEGIVIYRGKPRRGSADTTATIPGTY